MAIWIDESFIGLDIVSLANAILMCPAFVRLQLALSFCQSVHGRKIKAMLSAKVEKVNDRYLITTWIYESLPYLGERVSR